MSAPTIITVNVPGVAPSRQIEIAEGLAKVCAAALEAADVTATVAVPRETDPVPGHLVQPRG